MSAFTRWRAGLRALLNRDALDGDLDRELHAWVDELAARYEAHGLSSQEARRRAVMETGGIEQVKACVRDVRVGNNVETTLGDVRYAWRGLRRTPAFALVTILTLGLGIGATTAIFSLVNALLLEELPFRDPAQLALVWRDGSARGYPRAPLAAAEIEDLRDRATLFSGFEGIWSNTVVLSGDDPEQLRVGLVTTNFFSLLGAAPALGRTFDATDESSSAPRAILLSAAVWQRRYGSDASLIGRTIQVGNQPTTVIGVMPPGFRLMLPPDASVPDDLQAFLLLSAQHNYRERPRGQRFLRVVGRMKPGVRLSDAAKEIETIGYALGREFPDSFGSGRVLYAVGLHADSVREIRPTLLALFAGVALLLVVACVNVASLLVARAASRGRETAVRIALGAGTGRLLRQYAIEGLVLGALGGLAGILVGRACLAMLIALRPVALSRIETATIDPTVMTFAAGIALTWGLLLSLAPLAEARREHASAALQHGERAGATGLLYRRRAVLVVCQLALSVVLLVSAGLITRAFIALMSVDPGFSSDNSLTFRLATNWERFNSLEAVNAFSADLRSQLAALPGVTHVGAISHLPYDELPNWGGPYYKEGETDPENTGSADMRAITPGLFETVGAQLIEGRLFTEADDPRSIPVAIVDERLARRMWPGESALGKRIVADPHTSGKASVVTTVVGVVRHLRHRQPTMEVVEQIYVPARQAFRSPMAYLVKGATDAAVLVPQIRDVIQRLDPTVPIYDVRPLSVYVVNARADRRFTMILAGAFASVALILAGIGVYGVTAYAVARRRRELGVRLAIGASRRQVVGLVVGESMQLAIAGLVLGLLGAGVAASLLRTQLFGITPADPVSYAVTVVTLTIAVALAAWLPTRRATRVSPLESLRME